MNNLDEIIEAVSEIVDFIKLSKITDGALISTQMLDTHFDNMDKYTNFVSNLMKSNDELHKVLREADSFRVRLIILKYFKMTGNLS